MLVFTQTVSFFCVLLLNYKVAFLGRQICSIDTDLDDDRWQAFTLNENRLRLTSRLRRHSLHIYLFVWKFFGRCSILVFFYWSIIQQLRLKWRIRRWLKCSSWFVKRNQMFINQIANLHTESRTSTFVLTVSRFMNVYLKIYDVKHFPHNTLTRLNDYKGLRCASFNLQIVFPNSI